MTRTTTSEVATIRDEPVAASQVPRLREFVVLLPLLVIDVVLFVWLRRHYHVALTLGSVNVVFGLFLAAWKFLPDETVKGARLEFTRAMSSRRWSRILWIVFGVILCGSLFFSSVHVEADSPSAPVIVYRFDESRGSEDPARTLDSVRLDRQNGHRHFHLFTPPTGRRFWLQTSTYRRSAVFSVRPWSAVSLSYPEDFSSVVSLAMLPAANFLTAINRAGALRVVVSSDSSSATKLAEDTIRDIHGLILSFAQPPPADSAARIRWLRLASSEFDVDTAAVGAMVNDWMRYRWMPAGRVLTVGERLRIVVLTTEGDTLSADTLTLSKPLSDVIVHRRR